jgi:lycopene beta-cyclase
VVLAAGRHRPDDRSSWRNGVDRYQYLLLMAACLAITLPLELVLGARVYRRPTLLLMAMVPVVVAFSVWDVVGIWRGHWSYNPLYVTGIQLPLRMPLEELVFFVVIPICGLLTYEAVGRVMALVRGPRSGAGAGTSADSGTAPGPVSGTDAHA